MENWIPKTDLGRSVRQREITDLNQILDNGHTILEPEIIDVLMPEPQQDLLLIGQSKGKFGGGRRRVFRQTQKKTREGNKPRFAAYAVIGNGDGFVGLGYGKARETVPAREKAVRKAKLNVFKIARGSGSWESNVNEPHTIPFRVEGRCGSVRVVLMPAPKGKGLIAEKEIQKILAAAGVQDVWSRTFGQTKNKINVIKATEQALKKLITTKLRDRDASNLSITYGSSGSMAIAAAVPKAEPAPARKPVAKPAVKAAPKPAPKAAPKEEAPKPAIEVKGEEADASVISLTEVAGVGPSKAKKLEEVGIGSAQQLALATPGELVELVGVSEGAAEKLISAAKAVVGDAQ